MAQRAEAAADSHADMRAGIEPRAISTFLEKVIDAFPDATLVIGRDYGILYANRAARAMSGVEDPLSACLKCHQASHRRDEPCGAADGLCPLKEVLARRAPVTVVHTHRDAKGKELFVEITAAPIFDEQGDVVQIVETCRDITERRRTQKVLEIANRCSTMRELLKQFVAEFKRASGCAAVGIRIVDPEGTIPYQESDGFSPEFLNSESPVSLKTDRCLCIKVVKGVWDAGDGQRTEGGSFHSGSLTGLLSTSNKEAISATRGVCQVFGYESVALVPIRAGEEPVGVVHLADPREDAIALDTVESTERAAMQLATAIQRVRAEEALRRAHDELEARVRARTAELAAANRALQEEVGERNRLEREILRVGERERQRIGHELHDGLGQDLTGLAYVAKSLHESLGNRGAPEGEAAAALAAGIPQALKQVRTIVKGLLPLGIGAESLVPALETLVANVQERTGVSCLFQWECPEPLRDDYLAMQLFRITQEALTNAVRHAHAGQLVVELRDESDGVALEIHDDGVGIPADADERGGAGLRIMRYRARGIGASLEVSRLAQGGTLVRCVLPKG